jgi:fido (protein-threonine AMPylation protein)
MRLADCPSWEYDNHPRRAEILATEVAELLVELRTSRLATVSLGDSRAIHHRMFGHLAPAECPYYAGHFRGENFLCLLFCHAFISSDPRVGSPPESVLLHMSPYIARLQQGLAILDQRRGGSTFVLEVVRFACHLLEAFLRIHPYVNGNGHIGRLTLWAVLGRYGFWPERWPVEPRPPDPPYTDLIRRYRDGEKEPLELHILGTISVTQT